MEIFIIETNFVIYILPACKGIGICFWDDFGHELYLIFENFELWNKSKEEKELVYNYKRLKPIKIMELEKDPHERKFI